MSSSSASSGWVYNDFMMIVSRHHIMSSPHLFLLIPRVSLTLLFFRRGEQLFTAPLNTGEEWRKAVKRWSKGFFLFSPFLLTFCTFKRGKRETSKSFQTWREGDTTGVEWSFSKWGLRFLPSTVFWRLAWALGKKRRKVVEKIWCLMGVEQRVGSDINGSPSELTRQLKDK